MKDTEYPKYTYKEPGENLNVSRRSPLREFLTLLGGLLGAVVMIYVLLGLAVDWAAPRLPGDVEASLGRLFEPAFANAAGGGQVGGQVGAREALQGLLDELAALMPEDEGGKGGLKYRVSMVDGPRANAGAFPGGTIVVFTPLVREAESENEVAFVLGHELGHFRNRDHIKRLGRGLVLLVLSTALLGSDNFVNDIIMNSLSGVEMRFSQSQETAADITGIELLNRKYGHVGGTLDFFKRAGRKNRRGRFAYFFATHPHPEKRVEMLKDEITRRGYEVRPTKPLGEEFGGSGMGNDNN